MHPAIVNKKYLLEIKQKYLNSKNIKDDANRKSYLETLMHTSQEMVKNWDISYEKKLTQKDKEINEKKKAEELSRIEFYKKLMIEKQKEREKLITDIKDTFFKQKDEPRQLESALLCAEMLKEQEIQREFNKNLKEKEKERDLEYSLFINKISRDWLKDQCKKKQLRMKKDMEESLLVKEQAEKNRQDKIETKRQKMKLEKDDIEEAKKENDKLNATAIKMKNEECNKFKNYVKSAMDEVNDRKKKEKELNEKENKLIEIHQNTQFIINEMRKKKEKQIAIEKTKARDIVRKTIVSNQKQLIAEEERYLKAQEDFKKREIEMIKKESDNKNAKKYERIKFYQEWLEEEKKRREIRENIKTWEITNRLENNEYTKKLNDKLKKEHIKKITENKLFVLQQQKELMEKKAREKNERFEFYVTNMTSDMKAADEKFLSYAHQLLNECESKGRPTYPLHKVINDYKTRYMPPDKKIPKHLRTHFTSTATEITSTTNN